MRVAMLTLASAVSTAAHAQSVTQRGFVEARGLFFPQDARNDATNLVGDVTVREDVFIKPESWVQFAAGLDARLNTYGQVERSWRLDAGDRRTYRPALSLRRLTATLTRGPLTVDVGRQFVRWGKTDIVTPTDRFAPRDFLNVVSSEFLAVAAVRGVAQWRSETFDVVWVPLFTPSRTPLLDQRWVAIPQTAAPLTLVDVTGPLPAGDQRGVRWAHTGAGYELSASYFDGFNHLPNIRSQPGPTQGEVALVRDYPRVRAYGVDAALPTRWFTAKGEAAYFTSTNSTADEYVLYVIQLERQTGEWQLMGGYAGETVTRRRVAQSFAPDRGLTRAFVVRASYTLDSNRSASVETAIRQNGNGAYGKAEFSQARGLHWRTTVSVALIRGEENDFLGQYRLNSHATFALRYSF